MSNNTLMHQIANAVVGQPVMYSEAQDQGRLKDRNFRRRYKRPRKDEDGSQQQYMNHFHREDSLKRAAEWKHVCVETNTQLHQNYIKQRGDSADPRFLTSEFDVNTSSVLHGIFADAITQIRDVIGHTCPLPEVNVHITNNKDTAGEDITFSKPAKAQFQWYQRLPLRVLQEDS